MKPRQPALWQGAKSGGSVSQDEGVKQTQRSAKRWSFFHPPGKERNEIYGKTTVYF